MKATIRPTLLLASGDDRLEEAIRLLCRKKNILFRGIAPCRYTETIASIFLNNEIDDPEGTAFPEPLVLFAGFSSKQLDIFLEAYREAGIPMIARKAMMTPTNRNWTLSELYLELGREHEEMEKNRKNREDSQ